MERSSFGPGEKRFGERKTKREKRYRIGDIKV